MASISSVTQDQFSCPVCLDVLNNPVTVPCGHSFCMECINNCWDQEDQKRIYSCPQCRHSFTTRPVLHKNVMIAEMLEKLTVTVSMDDPPSPCSAVSEDVECDVCTGGKHKAVVSCLVCLASYCETHIQPHYESPAFKKHKLVKASRRLQEQICTLHEKILEVYCCTDHQCICMLCTMDKHRGHLTVSVAAERAKKQKQLVGTKRQFQKRIQERQIELQELRKAVESYKHSAQAAVQNSERIFTEIISSIERKRSEVTELIRAQEKIAVGRAETTLRRLEQEITELRKRDAELEQLSHTEDHIYFLKSWPSLSITPRSAGVTSVTFSPLLSFEGVTNSMSWLREKLEEVCDEEFTKVSKRMAKIQIILPPEPKSREEFLEYSCKLTLDPNTANPHLFLTEGNTVVSSSNKVQPYCDHPERFDYWPQLLCKEGFCGRCYWEVDWSGSDGVFMAVSYAAISRKGRAVESVFGCSNQSWTLLCSPLSYSFKHNNEEITIRKRSDSSTVGVYLDHQAGTLSFYRVSDQMTLLHRVHTKFTHPLYAGFWIHPGSMIRLSH